FVGGERGSHADDSEVGGGVGLGAGVCLTGPVATWRAGIGARLDDGCRFGGRLVLLVWGELVFGVIDCVIEAFLGLCDLGLDGGALLVSLSLTLEVLVAAQGAGGFLGSSLPVVGLRSHGEILSLAFVRARISFFVHPGWALR